MNTRPLNEQESKNLTALNEAGCNSVLLFLTGTGLEKGILDATEPMRRMFLDAAIHDYARQGQGEGNKIVQAGVVLTDSELITISISLYRPVTKNGDPRLWFYGFKKFAAPNDVCAVFIHKKNIYTVNLTRSNIADSLANGVDNQVTAFLRQISSVTSAISQELLQLLKNIATAGPIKAECKGDTAIGRSIETALGIKINSSRKPDYKGIEIKSGRSSVVKGRENRATLFGCVPDWDLSRLKSSRKIFDRFGYHKDGEFQLNCTVKVARANSQGLQLGILDKEALLREFYAREPIEEVCIWRLERLHERLAKKHGETFWVKAKVIEKSGIEWFQLETVTHTSKPSMEQFDRMLADSTITLDHLSEQTPSGGVHERGPLFKIERPRLGELFLGVPHEYSLLS